MEWVEIIEPRTKERMYANLTTGECVWDPPEGVTIKRTDSSQWWELFDTNTQRFYYYNATSQTTVWHRPQNCDIIPLAKLQTLKQGSEPSEKKDGYTQTSLGVSTNLPRVSSRGQLSDNNVRSDTHLCSPQSRHSYSYKILPESSSSHNIPSSSFGSGDRRSHHNYSSQSRLSYSKSNSSDLAGLSPAHSANATIFKKKIASNDSIQKREPGFYTGHKQKSFDQQAGNASLSRSGRSSSHNNDHRDPALNFQSSSSCRKSCIDTDVGAASDDSMHEKYFKSVENTPMSRRRHGLSTKPKNKKHSTETSSQTGQQSPSSSLHRSDQYLNMPHNKGMRNTSKTSSTKDKKKRQCKNSSSDVEYDNGNTSPLYSNWDQEMQEHLLPLQHYILEQAKLSGCYSFGEPLDTDSYHSDSQSEHSFSGHEPDNEDSDHSDRGGYLTHNYGLIDGFASNLDDGVSYYGYGMFDRTADISEHCEAVLESERENTKVYTSPKERGFKFESLPKMRQPPPPILSSPNRHPDLFKETSSHKSSPAREEKSSSLTQIKPIPLPKPSNLQLHLPSTTNSTPVPPPTAMAANKAALTTLDYMKECDIEKFAQDNLNLHSKGIFRKKSSVRDMLSWTGEAISRPMLALDRDKAGKKSATELFKLIQIYMGDRKARVGMSLNSVAIDIISAAIDQQQLRDELYVQLCRQTTENPKRESLIRGWELMAICLSFVPPSATFQPALLNYVNRHRDPTFATSFPEVGKWPIHVQISHYATVCCRRLNRIGVNGKKRAKKANEDEVEQSRNQILRDSMFGNTLAEVMQLQKDKYPERKLPWIQVILSDQVLLLNGKQTEGIFRVSADVDEVNTLKNLMDRWEVPELKSSMDAHAPASLLKLWYRELYDPLIPDSFYNECVQTEDPVEAVKIVNRLPDLNKLVLMYLVNFLQQFAKQNVVTCTKMDSSNLAMVFAPNCLRCTSEDPKVILENARKEMAFMRTLIQHMDTSSVANLT